ncbi:MAG: PqqD family protein [Anaerolineales bacterium]|nr:PqqD family protein [Anaerolineales bacterium]
MTPSLTAASRLARGPKATFQVVAEEAILIHLDTGTYYSLNRVGTELWERLDGEQTLQAHAAALAQKYTVEEARVLADLLELGGRLLAEDLVAKV